MKISGTEDGVLEELRKIPDEEIIDSYNDLKEMGAISLGELNFQLAEKVFREFNDFNLKIIGCGHFGHKFAPRSVLPYPRNYIICAYHICLEYAKQRNNPEFFELIKAVGFQTVYYPTFDKYKKDLDDVKRIYFNNKNIQKDQGEAFKRLQNIFLESQEKFKKIYGTTEVSLEDYVNSPNSADVTDEKLVYDFGVSKDSEIWKLYQSDNEYCL